MNLICDSLTKRNDAVHVVIIAKNTPDVPMRSTVNVGSAIPTMVR
ncbi:hypothetical protein JCM19376_37580 [Fusibacter bizertensis]